MCALSIQQQNESEKMVLAFVGNKLDLENDPNTPRVISTEVRAVLLLSRISPLAARQGICGREGRHILRDVGQDGPQRARALC